MKKRRVYSNINKPVNIPINLAPLFQFNPDTQVQYEFPNLGIEPEELVHNLLISVHKNELDTVLTGFAQ